MTSSALEIVKAVESRGGRLWSEDGKLIVEPASAGEPLLAELKAYKQEILLLLKSDDGMDAHDPACWQDDFKRWLSENCISRPGKEDSQSVGSLHVDFCEWAVANDSVPCTRRTFEALLASSGIVTKDGVVQGVILRADLLAHEDFAKYAAQVQEQDARMATKRKKTGW
jgi:hypothetical protein